MSRCLLTLVLLLGLATPAWAQDTVRFPSFDGAADRVPTQLTGYLFKPSGAGPMPAAVFMHGCGGLISASTRRIVSREMDWAAKLNAQGIAVLMVDSFTPREAGEMCSRAGFKEWLYLRRPADAYGGLAWLQQQPWVARDRVAMVGWSNGGGAVLFALGKKIGRPAAFAGPDFRAAIAFYPGSCSEQRVSADWTPNAVDDPDRRQGRLDPARALQGTGRPRRRARRADYLSRLSRRLPRLRLTGLKRKELTAYTTRAGVVPITGEDPASRTDAIKRVQGFLARRLTN